MMEKSLLDIIKYSPIEIQMECDDLPEVFIREALYIRCPDFDKKWIENMTSVFYESPLYRDAARERVIKELYLRGL